MKMLQERLTRSGSI